MSTGAFLPNPHSTTGWGRARWQVQLQEQLGRLGPFHRLGNGGSIKTLRQQVAATAFAQVKLPLPVHGALGVPLGRAEQSSMFAVALTTPLHTHRHTQRTGRQDTCSARHSRPAQILVQQVASWGRGNRKAGFSVPGCLLYTSDAADERK